MLAEPYGSMLVQSLWKYASGTPASGGVWSLMCARSLIVYASRHTKEVYDCGSIWKYLIGKNLGNSMLADIYGSMLVKVYGSQC